MKDVIGKVWDDCIVEFAENGDIEKITREDGYDAYDLDTIRVIYYYIDEDWYYIAFGNMFPSMQDMFYFYSSCYPVRFVEFDNPE